MTQVDPQTGKAEIGGTADRIQTSPLKQSVIWFCDDNELLGELYKATLELAGYRTRWFRERSDALAALHGTDQAPALIVTDFADEGHRITVEVFIEARQAQHPGLKILVASGYPETLLTGRAVRPHAFLEKPFLMGTLLERVNDLLGAHK